MIGDILSKIREEKGITKTELARRTGINIGHLTHIEKGERNPSQNTLKKICEALDTPYQPLLYTYGKTINENQEKYGLINYIPYNKVLAIENINGFIECPKSAPSSAIAIKIHDNSMSPNLVTNSYAFVEFNSTLDNKEIGLFYINDLFYIRRFYSKNGKITLKADNKDFSDINIKSNDLFYIVGKIVGES